MVSCCIGSLQSGGHGTLFLMGLAIPDLSSIRRGQVSLVGCPGNRLTDVDLHEGSLLGCAIRSTPAKEQEQQHWVEGEDE